MSKGEDSTSDKHGPAWKKLSLHYSTPELIFHSHELDQGVLLLVIGGDGEGAYEWVIERNNVVDKHSDCGYGSPDYALRDGLIEYLGLPSEIERRIAAPSAASTRAPTDKEIQDTLFLFRAELDKNMDNSSGSPGHDAMRVALGKLFKGLALPSSEQRPAHTDHPLRHFDTTCPACSWEAARGMSVLQRVAPSSEVPRDLAEFIRLSVIARGDVPESIRKAAILLMDRHPSSEQPTSAAAGSTKAAKGDDSHREGLATESHERSIFEAWIHAYTSLGCDRESAERMVRAEIANAQASPSDAECKGAYWNSRYQGPCWVCECCDEHGCKESAKHCHRVAPASATRGRDGKA